MTKKFFLRLLLGRRKRSGQMGGFTLIELLVAMLIATLIISSLLGFLVNILDSDRKEQAKNASQDEIKSALNYIANDMSEAIYIYNADGLAQITGSNSTTTCTGGATTGCSQLPAGTNEVPILVFWKRHILDKDSYVTLSDNVTSRRVRCLPYDATTPNDNPTGTPNPNCAGPDRPVFSLVAYYLIKDSTPSSTWSSAARIGRFEVKNGITDTNSQPLTTSTTINGTPYFVAPDPGFNIFDISSASTVDAAMKNWVKSSTGDYNLSSNPIQVLVDYIDDTPSNNANVTVAVGANTTSGTSSLNTNCDDPGVGVGNSDPNVGTGSQTTFAQRIPATFTTAATTGPSTDPNSLTSFYACVNSTQSVARIYLRGNALARLSASTQRTITSNDVTFLPTANVRAFGRGFLSLNN